MDKTRIPRWIGAVGFLTLSTVILGAAVMAPKAGRQVSPPYTVMVALEMQSPFVADGRMSFADLAFSATFTNVTFVYDPKGVPSFCSVKADEGKLFLTRHEFNDVEGGAERHKPWVKKPWPMKFPASLAMSRAEIVKYIPKEGDAIPLVPLGVPGTATLFFTAKFGLLDLMWYSELGSNALSDTFLEFDAPWPKLIDGKPVTLKIPYAGSDPEEKGTWWIEFIPPQKK